MPSDATQALSPFDECRKKIEEAQKAIQEVNTTNVDVLKFYDSMHKQDGVHQEAMNEIAALQYHLYQKHVYDEIEEKIKKQAEERMNATIEEQVKAELKKFIPQNRQQEVAKTNRELDTVMINLYNCESRRANSFLQHENPNKELNKIKMPNGNVSAHFPNTLKELFELDEERIRKLANEYPDFKPEGSPFARVNLFLQFCGVRYQIV